MLKIISRSTFDLQSVFDTLVKSAHQLCEADSAFLFQYDGKNFTWGADYGFSPEYKSFMQEALPKLKPDRGTLSGRVALERVTVHIPDYLADPEMQWHEAYRIGRTATLLGVPLLRDGVLIGELGLVRTTVRPFTEAQIELAETFADQAVIAIENVRLFEAEQKRTAELTESLEQQTATAEVLSVISSSPGELEPVFQAMLENAVRICEATVGVMFRYQDGAYTALATRGVTAEFAEYLARGPIRPGPGTGLRLLAETSRTVHIADARAGRAYEDGDPWRVATAELLRARSLLNVPMLKEGKLIGAIGVYREEVWPFSDKQIELVTNFAAQAVIAIENTRLLNELRQSLEQQTATADVLRVISSSPGDLEPVFQTMLANAVRICEANFGTLFVVDGDEYRTAAGHNMPAVFLQQRQRTPMVSMTGDTALARVARTKRPVQISDVAEDPAYQSDPQRLSFVSQTGARTVICVPMLKDGALVGAVAIYRQEVRPFADNQIELLTNFAAQAVIAIENTRLLNELRQSLEQQTATADVLRVISSSPGDLEPVFRAMLENATRICEAKFGVLSLSEGDALRVVATHNAPPAYVEFRQREPSFKPEGSMGRMLAQAVATKRAVQIADVSDEASNQDDPQARQFAAVTGARCVIAVPMLKDKEFIGDFTIFRPEPGRSPTSRSS